MTREQIEHAWRLAEAFAGTTIGATDSLYRLLGHLYADDKAGLAHINRVAQFADRIGSELGLPETVLDDLERAALLHDLGRLVYPDLPPDASGRTHKDARQRRAEQVAVLDDVTSTAPYLKAAVTLVLLSLDCTTQDEDDLESDPVRMAARVLHLADTLDTLNGMCVQWSETQADPARRFARAGDIATNDDEPWLAVTVRVN